MSLVGGGRLGGVAGRVAAVRGEPGQRCERETLQPAWGERGIYLLLEQQASSTADTAEQMAVTVEELDRLVRRGIVDARDGWVRPAVVVELRPRTGK